MTSNSNGEYGEKIWEEKIKKQDEVGVIFGRVCSIEDVKKETKEFLGKLEGNVFPRLKSRSSIIDLGVGPMARFSIAFDKRGYKVTGVDFSETTLRKAKEHITKNNAKVDLIKEDITTLKSIKEKFDMAFCRATFYHIPIHLTGIALMRVHEILKKDGIFVVEFGLSRKKNLWDFVYWTGHYIKRFFRRGFRVNVSRFTRREIKELIYRSGFEEVGMVDPTTYILKKR